MIFSGSLHQRVCQHGGWNDMLSTRNIFTFCKKSDWSGKNFLVNTYWSKVYYDCMYYLHKMNTYNTKILTYLEFVWGSLELTGLDVFTPEPGLEVELFNPETGLEPTISAPDPDMGLDPGKISSGSFGIFPSSSILQGNYTKTILYIYYISMWN